MKLISSLIFIGFVSLSCGKSNSGGSSGGGKTYSFKAVNSTHLAQSFAANTPTGFKSSTSLQLLDACATQYGSGSAQATACSTMADIQSRFFSGSGPTDIKTRLSSLDTTLNSAIENVSTSYVPCLDSTRTSAASYTISETGVGNATVTFPAFALTTVPLKSSFLNSFSIDTGDTLKLSCFDGSNGSASTGVGNAYGFDSSTGTWYLYDLSSNHIGMFGSSDQNDNINMWFSIGDTSYATDQGQDADEKSKGSSIYGGSTGIVQIISKPSLGLVGLTQVGVGIGPGCGAQLLMNSSTLYFVGNVNGYGQCFSSDFAVTSSAIHDPNLDSVAVCMSVSGSTVTPTADLSACVASGLISLDDSGNVVSPFSNAGLKSLTALSGVSSAITVRAWMGSFFMSGTDFTKMPPMGGVTLQPSDTLNVSGYSASSFAMNRTTTAANQNTTVTALCSATGSSTQTTMNESFQLLVSDIVSAEQAQNSKITTATVVSNINAALANTGTAAATISVPVTGIRGTSFYGTFSGTATATLDSTTLGTGTLTMPAKDNTMSSTASINFPAKSTVTSSSKFTVTVTGTLTLTCNNTNNISRTVSAKAAVPTIVFFNKNKK